MKDKKKEILFLLVIISFLMVIVIWQIFLKIFPSREEFKEDLLLKELKESGSNLMQKFNNLRSSLDNLKPADLIQSNNTITNSSASNNLTNQEKEIFKNKIFEYLNQKNNNER